MVCIILHYYVLQYFILPFLFVTYDQTDIKSLYEIHWNLYVEKTCRFLWSLQEIKFDVMNMYEQNWFILFRPF
jgi:hypothetical protein